MAKVVARGLDLRGTPLARVVTLLESSASYAGVDPYAFCVWAWPPKFWRARQRPQDSLQRSFRFELEGCWSHLTLFGRNSAWRRETARRLIRAGYEHWFSLEDQVDLRRWLRGKQERLRELAFLRDLGNHATPMRWPRRRPVVRPVAVQHGHWSRALWWSVIREVAEAGIRWNDATLGVSRVGALTEPRRSGAVRVNVHALALDRGRFFVFASASPTDGKAAGKALPPHLARAFRHVLRAAGFRPNGARSKGGNGPRGDVGFQKQVKSAEVAAAVCAEVFEVMVNAAATDPHRYRMRSQGSRSSARASARVASPT